MTRAIYEHVHCYSAVVPNQVDLIQFKATNNNGEPIDVKRIGKEARFRWETIRPFEQEIARISRSNDTTGLHDKLHSYWRLWETRVDSLSGVKLIEISLITTELAPEKRLVVLDSVFFRENLSR